MGNNFLVRHSVLVYFVFAFLISWVGDYLAVGTRFLGGEVPELGDIGLMAIPVLSGPFLAGILMTYLVDGRRGLGDLFTKAKKWRVSGRWYMPLSIFPILLFSVIVVLSVTVSSEITPSFLVPFLFIALLSASVEETGWTGFAFPRMSLGGSILGTGLVLGVVHGLWHFGPDFLGNYGVMGSYWLPYNIGFFIHVVALRILIVWVYTNTSSLFLAMMTHASSTGFYGFFTFNLTNYEHRAIFYIVYGIALCLVALAVSLKYGKTLKV